MRSSRSGTSFAPFGEYHPEAHRLWWATPEVGWLGDNGPAIRARRGIPSRWARGVRGLFRHLSATAVLPRASCSSAGFVRLCLLALSQPRIVRPRWDGRADSSRTLREPRSSERGFRRFRARSAQRPGPHRRPRRLPQPLERLRRLIPPPRQQEAHVRQRADADDVAGAHPFALGGQLDRGPHVGRPESSMSAHRHGPIVVATSRRLRAFWTLGVPLARSA